MPKKSGLAVVGTAAYAQHQSTEILCMSDAVSGTERLWVSQALTSAMLGIVMLKHAWMLDVLDQTRYPEPLCDYVASGGLIEAHNSMFEYLIWKHVCHERLGWPELKLEQLRCSASKCRAHGLPASLEKSAEVLGVDEQKGLGR